jgi:hypothetical protein
VKPRLFIGPYGKSVSFRFSVFNDSRRWNGSPPTDDDRIFRHLGKVRPGGQAVRGIRAGKYQEAKQQEFDFLDLIRHLPSLSSSR